MTISDKKALAIIPARGRSKRIPRKNIKPFLGKPIMEYSIQAARACKCFDEIMVSTDDKEIAEIAISAGAQVPFFRSTEASSDTAGTAEVLIEVLYEYEKRGMYFEYLCCIYPTAPFITAQRLSYAKSLLMENNVDCILPVTKFSYPIQRGLIIENGYARMLWPENYSKRSQDLQDVYHDCGQFYFLNTQSLIKQKSLFPEKTMTIIVPETEVQDIDNESDWKIAELKYSRIHQ
jgi:N-acylneuraminate cytidylyltransferase